MRRLIPDGMNIPRGYGLAFRDFQARQHVCYPLGIHLIVKTAAALYWRFIYLYPSFWERAIHRTEDKAYEDGYNRGYVKGLEAGYENAKRLIYDKINRML